MHKLLRLLIIIDLFERGTALTSDLDQLIDDLSALNSLFVEKQDVEHEAPAERLHPDDFCVLDMALIINLARRLEHCESLKGTEEVMILTSFAGDRVIRELLIDEQLLDLSRAIERRLREPLSFHESEQVIVGPHLDMLLIYSSDLSKSLHPASSLVSQAP